MVVMVQKKTEKVRVKTVTLTTLNVALKRGYALCYNRDSGAASAVQLARASEVEKPAAGNLQQFAGLLAHDVTANASEQLVKIFEPAFIGKVSVAWTKINSVINVTKMGPVAGEWHLSDNSPNLVATANQTVDTSSTAAETQVVLTGVNPTIGAELVTASSRVVTELPTAEIWNNFPIAAMRANPFAGSLFENDFRRGDGMPAGNFIDATYAASVAGKTPTEHAFPGITAVGELRLFSTTDNQAAELQWDCPIILSGGNKWAFEIRVKQSVLTDSKAGYFVGLMLASKLVGDLIVDGGTLQTEGSLGFQVKEGDGDKIDFVYDETGQSQNEHDPDYVTQVADTYNTLGMYFNGTTIQGYADGVSLGTAISAADISSADFPTAKVFVPVIALKAASADDFTVTVDWVRYAQLP